MALQFHLVTKENVNIAIQTQEKIFPKESGYWNIQSAVNPQLIKELYGKESSRKTNSYWICTFQKIPIGITGIYSYREYPKDAWCGWFGVLSSYRGQGYGKKILLWTMERAKKSRFRYFRLYTDPNENKIAIHLYERLSMFKEDYFEEDIHVKIFSKNLISEKIKKFGNKPLFLKKQEEIQIKSKIL